MIRIAIVEDENIYAEKLETLLHRYEEENKEAFDIIRYKDGDEIVESYKSQFDIILMDVDMKFMDGISAAKEIRKTDKEVVIIFITNMAQYAINGYEVDALDFFIKPVSYFAFSERLKRTIERMKKRVHKVIAMPLKGGGVVRLDLADVYYLESHGHNILVHTGTGIYEAVGTMKEAEKELKDMNFYRGNRFYIINLAHVDGVQDGCAIVKDEELQLSRSRSNDFMDALTTYWSEVVK